MSGQRWKDTEKAVKLIAPNVCTCDPDGITLYFFSSPRDITKIDEVKTPSQVEAIFNKHKPSGTTDLAGVLKAAFDEHFAHTGCFNTTILVITDGQPDNENAAIQEIKKAANRVSSDEELSVSFIQIGSDTQARKFLKKLDKKLDTKYDIVDSLYSDQIGDMTFEELMRKSLYS